MVALATTLQDEVLELKRQRHAVILAHNYQVPEIQDAADFVGDSLGLSQQAAKTDAEVIAFCGVHFMAETAKILNPDKTVIMPDLDAGCSLADSCNADALAAWKARHPQHAVVSYINCSAGVKALSDVICTSGNAVKVVQSIPADRPILFCPDQNLGQWVMQKTSRAMDLWPGSCYVHVQWTHDAIYNMKREHPGALLVAHPECIGPVRQLADEVCSTEKMVKFCRDNPAPAFLIATEVGMLHRLRKECPGKTFVPAATDNCRCNECRFMKLNTLEKLRDCLQDLSNRIEVPRDICQRALRPIQRMLEVSAA
ncbi:MAG: quinolinate synthase NadA [Verrucomicrobia bacterium]|nr:quinolinate synthase NadA [Verrucomicrobiota bacterium]